MSNWVERLAKRERLLKNDAPKVWNEIRSALLDACDSHRAIYDSDVQAELQNGCRLRIRRTVPANLTAGTDATSLEMMVLYNEQQMGISVSIQGTAMQYPNRKLVICLNEDNDKVVCVVDESKVRTADEISEELLFGFLFYTERTHSSFQENIDRASAEADAP